MLFESCLIIRVCMLIIKELIVFERCIIVINLDVDWWNNYIIWLENDFVLYIIVYICCKFFNNDVFYVEVNKWNNIIFIILEIFMVNE